MCTSRAAREWGEIEFCSSKVCLAFFFPLFFSVSSLSLSPSFVENFPEQIVREALQNSLQRLGLEYLDLYLLHWPGRAKLPLDSHLHRSARESAWKGLLNAVDCGLVRSVGVSNFQSRHLEVLFSLSPLRLFVGCVADESSSRTIQIASDPS